MNAPTISDINAPLMKGATAIGAAWGANTNAAEDLALSAVTTLAGSADPWWFFLLVSIPWGAIASFVAAVYTSLLLLEWLWKKPLRWALVKMRIMQPVRRLTETQWDTLRKDRDE